MKNKILILIFLVLPLFGCNSLQKNLSIQKKSNSDEFLVKKKFPLVMPPNFDQLPIPDSEKKENIKGSDELKSLIIKPNISNDSNIQKTTLEKKILEEISKN